jgi:hypothetical protein
MAAKRADLQDRKGAADTAGCEKLRGFIFDGEAQPFDLVVFAQYITGTPLRQQEGNLKRRAAGPAFENVAGWTEELWAACGIGC